jgi:hypothetical protein
MDWSACDRIINTLTNVTASFVCTNFQNRRNVCILNTVTHTHTHTLSLFHVAPTLESGASLKRFVSLPFLNPKAIGSSPLTGDQPVARSLPTETQNKHTQASMPLSGIPTRDPRVRAGEASSCLRPRGHCDRLRNY